MRMRVRFHYEQKKKFLAWEKNSENGCDGCPYQKHVRNKQRQMLAFSEKCALIVAENVSSLAKPYQAYHCERSKEKMILNKDFALKPMH